jgi:ABC-type Mn2+/Zn2+ transport system ATPase subunit
VKSGELVAVVGRVGAGKSSLLSAILGNMDLIGGDSTSGGKISYVPQNAWCQALSVRENIMFGLPVDEEWYRQVIHDCALELDLQILPKGDMSPAGLRGINLSGGQRQRVNLARAAYFNGDLVLLDNALSAVDHHTAQHIFDNLLRSSLREKAIILITHQVRTQGAGWAMCWFVGCLAAQASCVAAVAVPTAAPCISLHCSASIQHSHTAFVSAFVSAVVSSCFWLCTDFLHGLLSSPPLPPCLPLLPPG